MLRARTILHGNDLSRYQLCEQKQEYLSYIGRIAPIKDTHLAIEVAERAGIPLKIAGDVQPIYRDYFEAKIKPKIDGKFIEYIDVANLAAKNRPVLSGQYVEKNFSLERMVAEYTLLYETALSGAKRKIA